MSHKVHPKAFRIKNISDWNSRGFYGKNLSLFLKEDLKIRDLLEDKFKDASVENVEIERSPGKINIIISTGRPGIIIGRGGAGVEEIKKMLEKKVFGTGEKVIGIKIEIKGIRDVWASPKLAGEWIAQRLIRRMPHRKTIKQAMEKIMATKGVKGARIEIAGRLGGSEIARREWLRKGNLPRQTIRADIDYGFVPARCSYGTIGIKVWIYKGEKFD